MSTPRWMQGKPVEEKQKPRWMQGRAVDSGPLARNTAMDLAAERASAAYRSNQPIAPDDLAQLGRLNFSPAAMSRLPPVIPNAQAEEEGRAWLSAMEKGGKEKRAYDAAVRQEKMMRQLPDSDFKERMIIAMNVPTYGSGPRLAAGAQTVGALLATPFVEDDIIDRKGVSGAMSQFLDEARTHQRRARTERPAESIGIEVVPSLFQGKTIIDTLGKKVLPGTSTLSNVSRVAGVGTGYGALYAGSQNESGTVEGVARDAAVGGALGAGFGLGFKAAEPAVTAGYRTAKTAGATLYDALAAALGKAGGARDRVAGEVAVAAVRRSADRSGLTMEQMLDLVKKYEGKPAVLAEVIGQDALNSLVALTRSPGSTSQKATDIAEARATMLPDRAKADLEDASGIQIGNIDETLKKQLDERQAAAKPLYDALYKQYRTIESFRKPGQTGQVQKRLNRLARTPILQRHLELADKAMKTSAAVRGIAVSKMSVMERWDLVKRSLDDAIDSAVAKGEARTKVGESVGDLVRLKDELIGELDRLTGDAYAAARLAGGEAPRLRAAATAGQKALGARSPKEVAKTVAATLSQDLPAMQAGFVDDVATRIDKPGFSPRRFRSPDLANKVRAVFGEEAGNRFLQKMDAEADLAMKGSRWAPNVNSVTGTVMESGATAMGDDLINASFDLATGNKVGLMRKAINFMRQRGFSQRQIDAIGDLLLSSPEEGLRRLQVIKPDGPPAGLTAPIAGGPPSGGQPPVSGSASGRTVGKGKLGTRTADAAAIATLGLQGGTAEADTGGVSAELKTANEQVATATKRVADVDAKIIRLQDELDLLERAYAQDPTVDAKRVQLILEARDFDLGPKGPDGRIGPDTRIAIKGNIAKIEGEIAKQQTERSKAEEAEATALQTAKNAERQAKLNAMQAKNEPNMVLDIASKVAMLAGLAGGVYWAKRGRGGAVAKSAPAAKAAAARANALLNSKKLTTAKSGPNSLNQRAANINEFWKQGGAGRKVPFQVDASGNWTDKPGAMEPAQLFNPKWYQQYRNDDVLYMVTAAVDVGGSRAGINYLNDEIKKVETEYKTYETKDDYASMERKQSEKTRLEGLRTMLQITEKVGGGYLLGRAVGSPLMPYAKVNASVKAAEAQRASLLQKMNPPKKPNPAGNNQGQGNP